MQVVQHGDEPVSRFGQFIFAGLAVDESISRIARPFERNGSCASSRRKSLNAPLTPCVVRIAEKVLQELEAWAVELNVTEFILETGKRQPEAIRLYQRCEIIPNFGQYEGDENSVCMQKIVR